MLMHELAKVMHQDRERTIAGALRSRRHLTIDDGVPATASAVAADTDRSGLCPGAPAPTPAAATAHPTHVDPSRA